MPALAVALLSPGLAGSSVESSVESSQELERWIHRGGPKHWFNLVPARSDVSIEGSGSARHNVDTGEPGVRPALLLDCKAPGTEDPQVPLRGWMTMEPLPNDENTQLLVNPESWNGLLGGFLRGKIKHRITATWQSSGMATEIETTLVRERVKYSTVADWRLHFPGLDWHEVLRAPGEVRFSAQGEHVSIELLFRLSERFADFAEACLMDDGEWKRTRWRQMYEKWSADR